MKILTSMLLLLSLSATATNTYFAIGSHTAAVNTAIASAVAGDTLFFERGGFWDSLITINARNGSAGNPIVFRPYGSSGAKPIFNTRCRIPNSDVSGSWTNESGSKWWMSLSSSQNVDYRIWVDSVEEAKAYGNAITAERPVSYDTDWGKLYVWSATNPASAFDIIEYPSENTATIWIVNSSYLQFDSIDVRGSIGGSFDIHTSSNIHIKRCDVGWDANRMGIRAGTTGQITDVIVEDCTIDSGDRLQDIYAISNGVSDGVWMAGGCHRWTIRRNLIKDWGHSCVEVSNIYSGSDTTMSDILVYDNDITAPNVDYCRGIDLNSRINRSVTGMIVTRNYIHDMTIQSQLNTPNLVFSYNIIARVIRTTNPGFPLDDNNANGIQMAGNSNTWPYNMRVTNNVVAECAGVGLYLARSAGYNPIEGCDFSNNIFYNNGTEVPTWFPAGKFQVAIVANDSATGKYFIGNNIFKNNSIYSSTGTDVVWDSRHAANPYKTLAEFNSQSNGINGDQVVSNIGGDPLFNSTSESDFRLQSGSPAKETGRNLGSTYATGLYSASWPSNVVTGMQATSWNMGAYVSVPSVFSIRVGRVVLQ